MAILKIVRDSGYSDRLRAYQVILDGAKIGEVRDDQTQQFAISPGQHTLSLKIDWCGSKTIDFTVAGDEEIWFEAKSNLRGLKIFAALWYVIFDRHSYLLLEGVCDCRKRSNRPAAVSFSLTTSGSVSRCCMRNPAFGDLLRLVLGAVENADDLDRVL
jgi:hypothetical protein